MDAFTYEIAKLDNDLSTFQFSRLYTAGDIIYYVTTTENDSSYTFTMVAHNKGGWRIINAPKVPDWILELENELSAFIEAESR